MLIFLPSAGLRIRFSEHHPYSEFIYGYKSSSLIFHFLPLLRWKWTRLFISLTFSTEALLLCRTVVHEGGRSYYFCFVLVLIESIGIMLLTLSGFNFHCLEKNLCGKLNIYFNFFSENLQLFLRQELTV